MIYGLDELPAGAEIVRLTGDHMSGGVVDNHQRSRVLDCVLLAGVYYPIEHPGWIDTDAPMVPDAGVLRFHGADTGFRPEPEIMGRIGRDKRRPERLAFIWVDGRVSCYFDRDVDLDRVRVLASEIGLRVLDDGETVVRG